MTSTDQFDWIVTLDSNHSIDGVVSELTKLGLVVAQVLAAAGVVVAHGTAQQANQARAVQGVGDVSKDEPVDIGPPDAKIS